LHDAAFQFTHKIEKKPNLKLNLGKKVIKLLEDMHV